MDVNEPVQASGTPGGDPAVVAALGAEYGVLMAALTATWSISMTRVSLLLGVLSAVFVALTFAAQAIGFGDEFFLFAAVLLPLLLFLGLATFARVVSANREAVVYVVGMNRIRHAIVEATPGALPYLVLPIHDDASAIPRSLGGGMFRQAPRARLTYAVVQIPGLVAVVDAIIAGSLAFLVVTRLGGTYPLAIAAAVGVFLVMAAALLTAWQRSMRELEASLVPAFPTPPEALDRPLGDAGRP